MTVHEIRKQFFDFFASKGHQIVPSAPMVVKNDPTLMFTNAGMNQFKDFFLGNAVPKNRLVYPQQVAMCGNVPVAEAFRRECFARVAAKGNQRIRNGLVLAVM